MIDFVKVRINDKGFAQRLLQNPDFDFMGKINPDTGEQKDGSRTAEYRNLKIVLYASGMVEVTGSLHKFANEGAHNYDSFTYQRLVQTIGEMMVVLDTSPDRVSLHNVEFGVNILLDTSPSRFLDTILNYRFKLPEMRMFNGKGYLMQWVQQNYIVKVYDKKHQYRLDTNVLRFEVKTMAMVHLAGVGVQTLADLLDVSKLRLLGVKLCETYNGLIIGEKLDTVQMSQPERRIYEQGMNPNFWRDLTDRKQRNYYRGQFEKVIKKYGAGIRETVGRLIAEKVGELLKTSDVLPDPQNKNIGHFTTSSKGVKRLINSTATNTPPTTSQRRCKVCGTPIEHRRKDAVFCEQKQCRNSESNPRNNFKRRVNQSIDNTLLFEFGEVFRPTPQQREMMVYLNIQVSRKTTKQNVR
ncbi:hypothetical protein [Runella salmonicolor]|uniref:Uncharacterized protein n=1 Tax=Runella salmonicolor TaxID=2950278 RepID=A0ABT1FU25_9BACT|nr:hypothetical protein [Runella salmonicolor]MCP1385249.1 hypothetical protein [Runella salmonicolor]